MLTFLLRESIELSVFIFKTAHSMTCSFYKYLFPAPSEEKIILLEMKELKQEIESLRNDIKQTTEYESMKLSQKKTEHNLKVHSFSSSANEINPHDETRCWDEICLK